MKNISIPIAANISIEEIKKMISFISQRIEKYEILDNELVLQVDDAADFEVITNNYNLLLSKYVSDGADEKVICEHFSEKQFFDYNQIQDLVSYYSDGQVILKKHAIELFKYFNDKIEEIAVSLGAQKRVYPTLIKLDDYIKTGYLRNSPQYAYFCSGFHESIDELIDVEHIVNSESIDKVIDIPNMALSPSACFHTYAELENSKLHEFEIITFMQDVFRNEGRFNWDDFGRLKSYHVRETVFIGDANFVSSNRKKFLDETIDFLSEIDLNYKICVASDPFIIPKLQKYKRLQKIDESKYELRIGLSKGKFLSCASFNLHGNAFTYPFNIRIDGYDEPVTGCVGFGIERLVLSFLSQYGTDISTWPDKIIKEIKI